MLRRAIDRYQAWAAALLISGLCFAGAWAIAGRVSLPADSDFNVIRWELRHLPDKWLYLTGRFFRGGLSAQEEDARLGRYLVLTARSEALERAAEDGTPPAELCRLRDERDGLENDVEAIIEGRLTAVLEDEGLASSLPLFPDARWVFPPVDVELDAAPRVLAVSRRDRIELIEQRPLRADLSAEDIRNVEAEIERDGARSAFVDALAGIALYPSIVAPRASYQLLVETIAHEWAHHYLSFKPLGARYLSSVELRTLNETVADITGQELASLVVERYPLSAAAEAELEALRPPEPPVDVGVALHQLRLDVDELLGVGKIAEAEALMEQRRKELADQGVYYRRINQAFFAFRGLYATDPGSVDPIGEKLLSLRERTGSTGAFLRAAAELTGGGDLDRLLAGDARAPGGRERR